jgi:hypothetical protein
MDFDAVDFNKEYAENLKSFGRDWPSIRAQYNDKRFKDLEKKIEQIENNHLQHLTLNNMPSVHTVIEALYVKNKELVDTVTILQDDDKEIHSKLFVIKIAIVSLFIFTILLKWLT